MQATYSKQAGCTCFGLWPLHFNLKKVAHRLFPATGVRKLICWIPDEEEDLKRTKSSMELTTSDVRNFLAYYEPAEPYLSTSPNTIYRVKSSSIADY
jgi:hypothetical protein